MTVDSIAPPDIVIGLLLLFSVYVLFSISGWKKGTAYLVGLLLIGGLLAIITTYFSSIAKYTVAVVIIIIGVFLNKTD